jgi:hypothetical protein
MSVSLGRFRRFVFCFKSFKRFFFANTLEIYIYIEREREGDEEESDGWKCNGGYGGNDDDGACVISEQLRDSESNDKFSGMRLRGSEFRYVDVSICSLYLFVYSQQQQQQQ